MTILRKGVKIADKITKKLKLQATVTYYRALSSNASGAISYGSPTPLKAIVDYKSTQVRTKDGVLTVSRALITLIDIDAVIAATSGLGIDNNDKFVLPDGDTGPLLDIRGFIEAGAKVPIPTEVVIG